MDLRHYYAKIRQVEAGMEDEFVVLVSNETPDGGKAGVFCEAPRAVAAKMIVDGRARLASEEEARKQQARNAQIKTLAEHAAKRGQGEGEARGARKRE